MPRPVLRVVRRSAPVRDLADPLGRGVAAAGLRPAAEPAVDGEGDALQGAHPVPHGLVVVAEQGQPVVESGTPDQADAVHPPAVGGAGQPPVLQMGLGPFRDARADAPGLGADHLPHQGERRGAPGDGGEQGELVAGGGAGEPPVPVVAQDGVGGPGLAQHPVQALPGEAPPQLGRGVVVGAGDHRLEPSGLQAGGGAPQFLGPAEHRLHDQHLRDAGGVVRPEVRETAAQSAPRGVDGDGDGPLAALEGGADVLRQAGGEGGVAGRGAQRGCGGRARRGSGGREPAQEGSDEGPEGQAGTTDHDHGHAPSVGTRARPASRRWSTWPKGPHGPRPARPVRGSARPKGPPRPGTCGNAGPGGRPPRPAARSRALRAVGAVSAVSGRRSPSPGRRPPRRPAGRAGRRPGTSARGPGPRPGRARPGRAPGRFRRGPGGASGT